MLLKLIYMKSLNEYKEKISHELLLEGAIAPFYII
nr:MAG TPA_asm: hypothetical protein [Caudoviricetes sp.]